MTEYIITYYSDSTGFHFYNSVTIKALSYEQALVHAQKAVKDTYGSEMFEKFSFK